MGDRLPGEGVTGIARRILTSHPGQLSLLPSVGRQMNTDQMAALRLESKGTCLIPFVDASVSGRSLLAVVNNCHT